MAKTMPKHVPNGCGSAFGACLRTSAPQMACLGVTEPSLGCPPLPDPPRSWWGRLHRQLLRLHPSTNSSFCVGAPHRYLTYSSLFIRFIHILHLCATWNLSAWNTYDEHLPTSLRLQADSWAANLRACRHSAHARHVVSRIFSTHFGAVKQGLRSHRKPRSNGSTPS